MKTEHKILLGLILILLIVGIIIFLKDYFNLKNNSDTYETPFKEIKILNNSISLNDNQKKYEVSLNCSNLKPNYEIVTYKLNDKYKDSKISVHVNIFKDNTLLTEEYEGATNLDILLIKENNSEIIYNIKAKCE